VEGKPEDFRSDMYSLGAALFHALAGRPPHAVDSNSMRALAAAKKVPVNLLAVAPTVSSTTSFAVNKVLSHDPAKRQQSYAELIEHLEFARASLLGILPEDEIKSAAARSRSYGWLTALSAAVTVAVGVSGFEVREKLLARRTPVEAEEAAATTAPKEPTEMTYEKARQLITAGDFAKAEEAFTTLEARADTPQPQRNWVTLHLALAEFLDGHADKATLHLKALEERGPFSPDPAEEMLANFFVDTAGKADGTHAIPATAAKDLDRASYEGFALLLFGLKDWSLGEYDEAWTLLRQYVQVAPDSRDLWVADYKPVVSPYILEINACRAATETAKAANTMEARKSALALEKETREKIKLATGWVPQLDKSAADLQQKITAEEEATARHMAEIEAADTRALAEAKAKIGPLWQQFRPADAEAIMAAVQVTGEKGLHERENWVKKLKWLTRFKTTLINDVNTTGYASAVPKKAGAPMPGPIRRANESGIETVTPFGSLLAQWTDLSPDGIIAMAKSFLRPDLAPDALAERQWVIGVYAYFAGRPKDGRDFLVQASQTVTARRDELNLFLESTDAP
jgi:tetratricopeptide (TPR) repeat protein